MSKSIQKIVKEIKEQHIGATGKRALVVEGVDDIQAIEAFLAKKSALWQNNWVVVEANGKSNVIKILEIESDWIGIVDRDEWSEEIIAIEKARLSNLWMLPRYCLENYLIVPNELWNALPPIQKAKIAGGEHELQEKISEDIEKWVAHGVLWSVINPLWEGLRAKGFKEDLLKPEVALQDEMIQEKLQEWHNFLEPTQLFQSYKQKLLIEVTPLSLEEKLKRFVHGKKFYEQVVSPILNALLGQKAANDRQRSIFNTSQLPTDFDTLWTKMGV